MERPKFVKINTRNPNRKRIDYSEPYNILCMAFASLGLGEKLISQKTKLTKGQVVYRLKQTKLSLTDFRDGVTKESRIVQKNSLAEMEVRVADIVPLRDQK